MYWLRVTEDILRVVTPFVALNCSNIFATNGVPYWRARLGLPYRSKREKLADFSENRQIKNPAKNFPAIRYIIIVTGSIRRFVSFNDRKKNSSGRIQEAHALLKLKTKPVTLSLFFPSTTAPATVIWVLPLIVVIDMKCVGVVTSAQGML